MAEKTKLTVEERLTKATEVYKEIKAKYEETEKKLQEAEAKIAELSSVDCTALKERVKELEDEIAINGNSSEEIKALNTRLDKAKEVFADQKAKIAEYKTENESLFNKTKEQEARIQVLEEELDDANRHLSAGQEQMETYLQAIEQLKAIISKL